ncbi:hypothetical protein [Streptomyces sp. Ru62]|nr:hypothetical protein [Streptomyces sp. Ru62]
MGSTSTVPAWSGLLVALLAVPAGALDARRDRPGSPSAGRPF